MDEMLHPTLVAEVSAAIALASLGVAAQMTALAGTKPYDWPLARAIRRGVCSTALMTLATVLVIVAPDAPAVVLLAMSWLAITMQTRQWRYEGSRWFGAHLRRVTQPGILALTLGATYVWLHQPVFYASCALIFSTLHQRRMHYVHSEFRRTYNMLRFKIAKLEAAEHSISGIASETRDKPSKAG